MATRTIDELITRSVTTKSEKDYNLIFESLKERNLFFNLTTTDKNGKPTPPSMPMADIGFLKNVLVFYTSQDNPKIKGPYAVIAWQAALKMTLRTPAEGLIVENPNTDWVAIDKSKIKSLLGLHTIDDAIAVAAATKADEDYYVLFSMLDGVELFFNVLPSQHGTRPQALPLADIGAGRHAVVLYSTSDNPDLKLPYASHIWLDALHMVAAMDNADGLILQSKDGQWVAIGMEIIKKLIKGGGRI